MPKSPRVKNYNYLDIRNHQLDKTQWIELNKEYITFDTKTNDIVFTVAGPKDPPPLNIEIHLNPPLNYISNLHLRVDFERPHKTGEWSSPSWSGDWIEALPRSRENHGAVYEVLDSIQENGFISRLHLRISSYTWGNRSTKTHKSGQTNLF